MAIVKANYVKRGIGERARAKATIRYIQHRKDREGQKVTRALFGYDGALTREQAYQMIDEAQKGTIFYRFVLSPDPRREDRYKDLDLSDIATNTMLALEERLGKQIQFIATIHNDHSPHRHVHTLVLIHKQKLTREDFQALRYEATGRALSQRRTRDLIQGHHARRLRLNRSHYTGRNFAKKTFQRSLPSYQSYTCSLCNYHQSYSSSKGRYRCPNCGLYLRRERKGRIYLTQRRRVGLHASLSL